MLQSSSSRKLLLFITLHLFVINFPVMYYVILCKYYVILKLQNEVNS